LGLHLGTVNIHLGDRWALFVFLFAATLVAPPTELVLLDESLVGGK
jgi:hypothetical protein